MGATRFNESLKPFNISMVIVFVVAILFAICGENNADHVAYRRKFVENMTREAWKAYTAHAWGADTLKPISKKGSIRCTDCSGLRTENTIVQAMSTLWLIGMKDEFELGKQWILKDMNLTELTTRKMPYLYVKDYIGGLLSSYALNGDEVLLNKALEIMKLLEHSFETSTGLPYHYENVVSGNKVKKQFLSHITMQQPEMIYLADMTDDVEIKQKVIKIRQFMRQIDKPNGLYPSEIDVEHGNWTNSNSTLAVLGKNFYMNLIKSYIQSNSQNRESIDLFKEAIDAVEQNGMIQTEYTTGQVYVKNFDLKNKRVDQGMHCTACNLGAMFALAARSINQTLNKSTKNNQRRLTERMDRYMRFAKGIIDTCHQDSDKSQLGFVPWMLRDHEKVEENLFAEDYVNTLHYAGDLAESYFILWRTTHDGKYRDYAWQMAQAIHQLCRTKSGGYVNLDLDLDNEQIDRQPDYFFSRLFKYLFLIFTDDSVLPLDEWIFTVNGHPLPICGKNNAYPAVKCTF